MMNEAHFIPPRTALCTAMCSHRYPVKPSLLVSRVAVVRRGPPPHVIPIRRARRRA